MRLTRLLPKRLLGNSLVSAVGRRAFPRIDRSLQQVTRGRASLAGIVGMPLMLLETTGRHTGQPRVTPLTFLTQGADFLVVGSNWGQERHPAWALNLLGTPDAVVSLSGERIPVHARRLAGEERAAAWSRLIELWPAYDEYAERVKATSGREIMVFRLERG